MGLPFKPADLEMTSAKEEPVTVIESDGAPSADASETIDASHVEPRVRHTASSEWPVEDWDRYEFVRVLGAGGMGEVFLAKDRRLGRTVALKFIRGADPKHILRLIQEARAQSSIEHAGICKVYEVGEVAGKPFIAMQFVDGTPLSIARTEMTLHAKVSVIRDSAIALNEAHKVGIVHRDIKPSNILVVRTDDGGYRPTVMDFGLAREQTGDHGLTESGALLGTPAYMSPEQARGIGRAVDRRADVYSLGATLYELVTGKLPFLADSVVNVIMKVIHDDPTPPRRLAPSIPEDIETIVLKCLAKDPSGRYDSAKLLADDLERYIGGEPIVGRKVGAGRLAVRFVKKHRALVTVAFLSFVAVVIVASFAIRARIMADRHLVEIEEQSRLARELSQDAKEMEWFLRTGYELPIHDARREKAVVRARMADIERRGSGRGKFAEALTSFAIGTGHLALHEDDKATQRLFRAKDGGVDTPELHYALGVALGRRYDQGIAEARRTGDKDRLASEDKRLTELYLKPAIASLEKSRGIRLESPSYLEGLIAHHQHHDEEAVRLAKKAAIEAPWLYEAKQLEADVLMERGLKRRDGGDRDGGETDLVAAADLYEEAANIARSDATLYESAAEVWIRRMEMDFFAGIDPQAKAATAFDLCKKAMAIDPDRAEPWVELGSAHLFLVEYQIFHGIDPLPELAIRLDVDHHAAALDPTNFTIFEGLSTSYLRRAQYEMDHGLEFKDDIANAIKNAERSVEINPGHPWGQTALGISLAVRGQSEADGGENPEASWQAALAKFVESARVDPGYAIAYSNQLDIISRIAQHRTENGDNPGDLRERTQKVFDACMKVNPNFLLCKENRGLVLRWFAEYALVTGGDIEADAKLAEASVREALPMDFTEMHQVLAAIALVRAKRAIEKHADTTAIFASFDASLANCFRLEPKNVVCTDFDARRALLVAESLGGGAAAKGELEKARRLADHAVAANPRTADTHDVAAFVTRGLEEVEHGLVMNPKHPRLLMTRRDLLALKAKLVSAK
jgi:predicted Ser/Thr protein kinase